MVARGEHVAAFRDLVPQAPHHVLVVPVKHVPAVSRHGDPALLGTLVAEAARIGAELGGAAGFRLVVNEGMQGGQTVDHLHVHVLAGRQMQWPPG